MGHARRAHLLRGSAFASLALVDVVALAPWGDDVEPRYPGLDLPVLVVWGQDDTWLPVEQAHTLARLVPGARLRIIECAGHLIQFDQPEQLAVTLHDWLTPAPGP